MRGFVVISVCLAQDFLLVLTVGLNDAPTFGSKDIPRVLSKGNVHLFFYFNILTEVERFSDDFDAFTVSNQFRRLET